MYVREKRERGSGCLLDTEIENLSKARKKKLKKKKRGSALGLAVVHCFYFIFFFCR